MFPNIFKRKSIPSNDLYWNQLLGENIICRKLENLIGRFHDDDDLQFPISVPRFMFESIAYSDVTSVLLVCGGNQIDPVIQILTAFAKSYFCTFLNFLNYSP